MLDAYSIPEKTHTLNETELRDLIGEAIEKVDSLRACAHGLGIKIYPNGLVFTRELEIGDWMKFGSFIAEQERGRMFQLGDFVNYGEAEYGEKYSQALSHTDYKEGTLRNAAYVCNAIPLKFRNPRLTYSHHYHVSRLDLDEAKRLLKEGLKHDMTAEAFKQYVISIHPVIKRLGPTKVPFSAWLQDYLDSNRDIWSGGLGSFEQDLAKSAWDAGQENK